MSTSPVSLLTNPKTDSVPAGTLLLVITTVGQVRQRWSETPEKSLDDDLKVFERG